MARYEWTDDEREVVKRLGKPEAEKRISELSDYRRYDILVSLNLAYDESLTPPQLSALAALAATFKGAEITQGLTVRRLKTHDELLHIVAERAVSDGE